LDEVEVLLNNIDAPKVVITADHGQALGERFLWDHRAGVQHASMRKVPWVETSAEDNQKLKPRKYEIVKRSEEDQQAQLRALGYA
jgi:hypothetical protein